MPETSDMVAQEMTWTDVAPLLARWQIALVPHFDRTWDVLAGYSDYTLPLQGDYRVPFRDVPAAIAQVAARCAAAPREEEG